MRFTEKLSSKTLFAGTVMLLCTSGQAYAQGMISSEKGCNVRIEGSNYDIGDKVLVFRETSGKKSSLAFVEIAKIVDNARLGKVIKIKDPSACPGLRGARTELYRKGEKESAEDGESITKIPKIDTTVTVGYSLTTCKGIEYPTEGGGSCQASQPRYGGYKLGASGIIYPLMFMGKKYIHKLIGIGVSVGYGSFFSNIPVEQNGNTIGSMSTAIVDYEIDAILRVLMLSSSDTEVRLAIQTSSKSTQTFKGDPGPNPPQVLANVAVSGLGIGFYERIWLSPFRFTIGALYGINQTGTVGDPNSSATENLVSPYAYKFDLGADFFIRKFKINGNFSYHKAGGNKTSSGTFKMAVEQIVFSFGGGIALK